MSSQKYPSQIVVFGQRGVGKTSFLKRLEYYWKNQNYIFLDLDQEIENHYQKKVSEIFTTDGEAVFRKYEQEVFNLLIQRHPKLILSVGGGFDVLKIPPSIHCLWLQRISDETGRIFLDRPRLDSGKTDLEEFFDRAQIRKIAFDQRADEIYLIPEGLTEPNAFEAALFTNTLSFKESTYITLTRTLIRKNYFLEKIQESGVEFRDDLLDNEEFLLFSKNRSLEKVILSFRSPQKIENSELFFQELKKNNPNSEIKTDWALELGPVKQLKNLQPDIISLHDYLAGENISDFLKRLEDSGSSTTHLKASPVIAHFSDLKIAYEWQQKNPQARSLLPRSEKGIWTWFRQFMKGRQKINFWKVSTGTAADQPSLYEWQATIPNCMTMAAVLGSPVKHSRTPLAQQSFFKHFHTPVFAIDISEAEFETAIPFLKDLGLIACAVTSPLKRKAYALVKKSKEGQSMLSPLDNELGTINTLFFKNELTLGTNTDLHGFQVQTDSLIHLQKDVLVWGGGGTLPIIKAVFPEAIEYSVRSGKARDENQHDDYFSPQIVIWAAAPDADEPSLKEHPKYVIDLNYKEDSHARSYAKKIKAVYISGEKMFLAQALGQQEFWKKYL